MGAIPCRVCGEYRKLGTVAHAEGIDSPPCCHCGDPGFTEPHEDEGDGCGPGCYTCTESW